MILDRLVIGTRNVGFNMIDEFSDDYLEVISIIRKKVWSNLCSPAFSYVFCTQNGNEKQQQKAVKAKLLSILCLYVIFSLKSKSDPVSTLKQM